MKAINKAEELVKATYRLPKDLCEELENLAITHRRSINDELITILEEYFAILMRFPEGLSGRLRRISLELNIPIKDIVSRIVEKNLDSWFAERAIDMMGTVEFSVDKIRSVLSKTSENDFISDMSKKLDSINASRELIEQVLLLVKHGVLPADAILGNPARARLEAPEEPPKTPNK
jgi:hypothetical protein